MSLPAERKAFCLERLFKLWKRGGAEAVNLQKLSFTVLCELLQGVDAFALERAAGRRGEQ